MKRHTIFGIAGFISGIISGALLVGIPLGLHLLKTAHHYFEHATFFEGQVGKSEVRGISYFDHHGVGFMESIQWKIEMRRPNNPDPTTIYTGKAVFQEALPHQPEVSIADGWIKIDDGEQILKILATDAKAEQGAASNPSQSGGAPALDHSSP